MTREELKEHCEKQMEMCEMWAIIKGEKPGGIIYEEHKLILELLEQESCEDAVSRQAVLEYIEGSYAELGHSSENKLVCQDIKELPPVTPQEPRWIPVSERLPKEDESVLLTICANSSLYGFNKNFVKVMCGSYSPCEYKRDWIVNGIRYYIDNVVAWMPLPKRYSEVEE